MRISISIFSSLLPLALSTPLQVVQVHGKRPIEVRTPLVRDKGLSFRKKHAVTHTNPRAYEAISNAAKGKIPLALTNFPLGPNDEDSTDLDVVPFDILTPDAVTVVVRANGKPETLKPSVQMVRMFKVSTHSKYLHESSSNILF
jgi:hypothetical protein